MALLARCLMLWTATLCGVALAADNDALEQQQMERRVAELAPLVEQITGRRFHRLPEVVIADPPLIAEVLYREQVHLLRRLADLDESEAQRAARRATDENAAAFVGKYGFLDKKLYVMQDGILTSLLGHGVPASLVEPVTDLVLAHELVHALQDQQADLAHVVANQGSPDAVVATNCTVEGHAVWVHEQVGRLLDQPAAVYVVANILGYDPLRPGLATHPDLFYTSYVYGQGRNFIAQQHEMHGNEGLWQLIEHPPASSSMIVMHHPYATQPPHPMNRRERRAIQRTRSRIAPRRWDRDREEEVGDYDLRRRLTGSRSGLTLADGFTTGWASSTAQSEHEWVEVQLLRFETEGHAQDYVGHMKAQAAHQLAEAMPPVASVRLAPRIDGTVREFEPMGYAGTGQETLSIDLGVGEPAHVFRQVWVARDQHVVQVTLANHAVADARVARAIRGLFRVVRLDPADP